jgi:hypothetical protein
MHMPGLGRCLEVETVHLVTAYYCQAGPPGATGTQAADTWVLTAAPEVISAGYQMISTIPEALQAITSPPLTTFEASLSSVSSPLSKLSSLCAPSDFAISHLNCLNKAAALRALLPNPAHACGAFTAGFGRATSIGTLSVPMGWVTETTVSPIAAERQRGWVCELIRLVEVTEPPM